MRVALAVAALATGLIVAPAGASPPVTPGSIPCPSISTGAMASVLALTDAGDAEVATVADAFGARSYRGVPAIGLRAWSVRRPLAPAFAAALRRTRGVLAVQPDLTVQALRTPHDPLLTRQWALTRVHAQKAWNVDIGIANPINVAVLDTGVDRSHPDLVGRVENGIDTVDGDSDASDEQFHGTAVASVIAADTDNRIGMAGLSWGAQVVPVRVLNSDGQGSECTIAAGLIWAADHARILNLSLGASAPCTDVMRHAVDYARNKGGLVVAAAGNSAAKGNPAQEPADCPGVLGIGATDQRDRIASFSEHGPQVALSAPGVRVLAAYRAPKGVETWAAFDGTSMAAPMVSGVAALVLSHHPTWTAQQVSQRLESSAVDLGKRGRDGYFGAGRVDAARALAH